MKNLQFNRNSIDNVFNSENEAKTALVNYVTSDTCQLADGEPVLARYTTEATGGGTEPIGTIFGIVSVDEDGNRSVSIFKNTAIYWGTF